MALPHGAFLLIAVLLICGAEWGQCDEQKLAASIYKFVFTKSTDPINDLATEKIFIGKDPVINFRGTEISKNIKVNSKITGTVKFSVAEPLTKINGVGVEPSVKVAAECGIPQISNSNVKSKFVQDYKWSGTSSEQNGNLNTVSQEEAIVMEPEIKIPPCRMCHVSIFVHRVKDLPITYTAYAKVSAAEEPTSSDEFKGNLPSGVTYVKNFDEHTVEGITEGTMYVDFGDKLLLEVNCNIQLVEDCFRETYDMNEMFNENSRVFEVPLHSNWK